MSYRTIKRLLGETSLERKCRFLFGGGLLLLITGSFYFYSQLNARLVYDQNRSTARMLKPNVLVEAHWKAFEQHPQFRHQIKELTGTLRSDELRKDEYTYRILSANPSRTDADGRPDAAEYDPWSQIVHGATEVVDLSPDQGTYNWYAEIRADESCLRCHGASDGGSAAPRAAGLGDTPATSGDLLGVVKISFPLERTEGALAWNNAVLLATAIVTAFLAMLAAYAIVRYVIVKPVLHLKNVSDEIARGTLDLRADIRTGDEFEELSHAFNRMLRHLTTVQDELREVNADLDAKVDELAQVNLRLYELNKLKDEFLATMSHELRTPLNSILGFSDVLAGAENLNEKQKRFLRNIQGSGRELMALINDVLDLAKIESGKMSLQPVEFSLGDLVERQVGSMMALAERKNIDLTSRVEPAVETVFQDPGKVQQILNNLLSNALKFTPEGGRVAVNAEAVDDRTMELTVEDTGIGIPLEDQDRIFEKFRQGKAVPGQRDAMTREYGGTGLGLSIVKELSKLLGGEVLLDSEFGKGSTFTIRIPIRLDEQPRRLDEGLHSQGAGLGGRLSTSDLKPVRVSADGDEGRPAERRDESAA